RSSALAPSALAGRRAPAPAARRRVARLAAPTAALLAAVVLLVDGRVADLLGALGGFAALLRALLDVVRLPALLARVARLAASGHERPPVTPARRANHVPVRISSWNVACSPHLLTRSRHEQVSQDPRRDHADRRSRRQPRGARHRSDRGAHG